MRVFCQLSVDESDAARNRAESVDDGDECGRTMGVTTVFEVEASASRLALAETFERVLEAEFRLERTAVSGPDHRLPAVWVSGVGADRAADLLAEDPSVADARLLGEDAGDYLFDVAFDGQITEFVETIVERDGVLLRASATDGVWSFQLRFADHADIGEAFDDEFCDEYGATVTRLYRSSESPTPRIGVTDKQRRALDAAFEMGYYDVPREVDLRTVGDELGISRQAVSERLRRGHEMLVAEYLGGSGAEGQDRQ